MSALVAVRRVDIVLSQVREVVRAQILRYLAPAGVGDVVQTRAQRECVGLGLFDLSRGRLGGGQILEQAPEEADVEVAQGVADREVVELFGREMLVRVGYRDAGKGNARCTMAYTRAAPL